MAGSAVEGNPVDLHHNSLLSDRATESVPTFLSGTATSLLTYPVRSKTSRGDSASFILIFRGPPAVSPTSSPALFETLTPAGIVVISSG